MSDIESQEPDYESSSTNEDEDVESEINNDAVDETNDEDVEIDESEEYDDGVEETKGDDISETKKNKKLAVINKSINDINFIDDDNDEEDDIDDNYLKKFNNNIIRNHLVEFHPESKTHNYIEIQSMSRVIRDENGNIIDELHKTIPFLTKYEKTRILGQRAKQIESGSTPFVRVPNNIIDAYVISQMELKEKKIPFIIRRPLPNGGSEYWKLSDLQILD